MIDTNWPADLRAQGCGLARHRTSSLPLSVENIWFSVVVAPDQAAFFNHRIPCRHGSVLSDPHCPVGDQTTSHPKRIRFMTAYWRPRHFTLGCLTFTTCGERQEIHQSPRTWRPWQVVKIGAVDEQSTATLVPLVFIRRMIPRHGCERCEPPLRLPSRVQIRQTRECLSVAPIFP